MDMNMLEKYRYNILSFVILYAYMWENDDRMLLFPFYEAYLSWWSRQVENKPSLYQENSLYFSHGKYAYLDNIPLCFCSTLSSHISKTEP